MDVVAGDEVVEKVDGVAVVRWPRLAALGVQAAVTTRYGGVSSGPYDSLNLGLHVDDDPAAVVENRRRAAAAVGATLGDLVVATQVHGTAVAVVGTADRGRGTLEADPALEGIDALVTAEPGVVLVTLVADCSPILLVDPVARVLCAVHAGWRGALAGVVHSALEAASGLGARPGRMMAAIGPTVGASTYEVGEEVAETARDRLGAAAHDLLSPTRPGHWLFDVAGANHIQLRRGGLAADAIGTSGITTADDLFFSDRRCRPCGRFGLLARLDG